MAGIEAAEEMTSDQLDAMAGGDLLKNEVIQVASTGKRILVYHLIKLFLGWLLQSSAQHKEIISTVKGSSR